MSKLDPLTTLRRRIASSDLDEYEAALEALSGVSDMAETYGLTNFVVGRVESEFDCVHCVPGCSECCSQLPLVTFDEWRLILDWMQDNLTAGRPHPDCSQCRSTAIGREVGLAQLDAAGRG